MIKYLLPFIISSLTINSQAIPTSSYKYDFFQMDAAGLDCSSDFNTCIAVQGLYLHLYKKQPHQYKLVHKHQPACSQSGYECHILRNKITPDGSRVLIFEGVDDEVKVYSIINNTLLLIQKIPFQWDVWFYNAMTVKEDYLMLGNKNRIQFYGFEGKERRYLLKLNYSLENSASQCHFSFSSDGSILVVVVLSKDMKQITLKTFSKTLTNNFTSASFPLSKSTDMLSFSQISDVAVEQKSSSPIIIISYQNDKVNYFNYYKIVNNKLFLQQQIFKQTYSSMSVKFEIRYVHLTSINCFLTAFSVDKKVYYLEYNSQQDIFLKKNVAMLPFFPDRQLSVSQNRSFMLITQRYYEKSNLYFQSTIKNCQKFRFIDFCQICKEEFLLEDGKCLKNKEFLEKQKVSICKMENCQRCFSENACKQCSRGYSLKKNRCICPSGKTVSLLSGFCVNCKIPNCNRCDEDDKCANFTLPQVVEQIPEGKPQKQKQNGSQQSASNNIALNFIIIVLILLVLVVAFLVKKINSLNKIIKQIKKEQQQSFGGKQTAIERHNLQKEEKFDEEKYQEFSEQKISQHTKR